MISEIQHEIHSDSAAEIPPPPPLEMEDAALDVSLRVRRIYHLPCKPATLPGFVFRLLIAAMSVISLCFSAPPPGRSTFGFPTPAFSYFVGAASVQTAWSITLILIDGYALRQGHGLQTRPMLALFIFGDAIVSMLMFIGASTAVGTMRYIVFIGTCSVHHCFRVMIVSIFFAFITSILLMYSFVANVYVLGTRFYTRRQFLSFLS